MIPSPPLVYTTTSSLFDLNDLNQLSMETEEQRQRGYDLSRKIHVTLVQARRALTLNQHDHEAFEQMDAFATEIVQQSLKLREPRIANLSHRMEEIARIKALQHFLQTGTLFAPSVLSAATDEEYLAGACMGLAQDLQRYGLGRATARDVDSVKVACDLVRSILDYLLGFDFRNGPLRRKYDGTKYSLKALETLLYELAVTGGNNKDGEEPENKRLRLEESSLLPKEELEAIRLRMVHRDELREDLIKKCRDGQKAAKQAIFALHRGDKERAQKLLAECHHCITDQLLPIIEEEPPLKNGSFSNVLEEYVEAKLFACWLYGPEESSSAETACGTILKPQDFDISLEPEVYLGGLCDLTGEVGRYAVQRGTMRDDDGVKLCLQTNRDIQTSIESMERIPNGITKKMDQLNRSVEKLERMLYEMSLSTAVGRNMKTEVEDVDNMNTGNDQV
jgi:predicted translin family RNA/ssDNA-binding protein